jgi:RNA recognition motif-containing protein
MNTKLYVGDLSSNVTEAQLTELFSQAGNVKAVTRPVDRTTKQVRNYAFVEMGTAEEAAHAIHLLNGKELDGHAIKVSEAHSLERNAARHGFDRGGGRHGHDQFIRGNSRSGYGRGSGHRGGG